MLTTTSAAPIAATFGVSTAQTVGVIIVGVLVLIAVAALFIIKKIASKVITVALVLILAAAVYVQRDQLSECPKTCECSFFGLKLKIPDTDLSKKCKDAVSLGILEQRSATDASPVHI